MPEKSYFPALSPKIKTLAEILRENGYLTVGLHGNGPLYGKLGFARGFIVYRPSFSDGAHPEDSLPEEIGEWLRKSRETGRPLFLFLHQYYCHEPYVHGLERFRRKFLDHPVPGLPLGPKDVQGRSFWRDVDLRKPEHLDHVLALYDGGVAYSDYLFRNLIDLLKETGQYDDAFIILLSDHGEEFYEHEGREHGKLFIEHLHVPLIIKFPRNRYAGRRVSAPVRLVDVMPTVLDYLKISADEGAEGISLLPLIDHQAGGDDPLISSFQRFGQKMRIQKGEYAYTEFNKPHLFHLIRDPGEQINVIDSEPEARKRMEELLKAARKEKLGYLDLMRPDGSQPVKLEEEEIEELKALGYIN